MNILFVTAASQTKMSPNQETICFEDLKDFPIKTKQQFRSQVNSLTFTLFIILILFLKKACTTVTLLSQAVVTVKTVSYAH